MTIDFGAKPTSAPPSKGGPWVWTGDDEGWVEIATDTGDGVPESLGLDADDDLPEPEQFKMIGLRVGHRVVLAKAMLHLPGKHNQKHHGDGGTSVKPDAGGGGGSDVIGEGDGHTRGTKFDTPVTKYGMKYSQKAADDPRVKELKTDDAAWEDIESIDLKLADVQLVATEEWLRSKPIDKVVGGTEPFREGYDAHLLRTDEGYVVIDGHHRVAMYKALDRKTMPAKIIDGRTPKTDAELIKTRPWVDGDRGVGAPGVVYTDEAELSAYRLLENYAKVEPDITADLSAAAEKYNGRMEGLGFRLKGQESLARKIEQKSASKGLTMRQYASKIGDALRYTMVVPANRYGDGAQAAIDDYRKRGYRVEVNNTWQPGTEYKGINTNVEKDGVIFEVQFHTPDSLALKMDVLHPLYEKARDTTVSPEERAAATKAMIESAAALPVPSGAPNVK